MKTILSRLAPLLLLALSVIGQPALAQDAAEAGAEAPASSVDLLIDVLEDEAARDALLERLRAAGVDEASAVEQAAEETGVAGAVDDATSFGRRIALVTQSVAEGVAGSARALWQRATAAPDLLDGLGGLDASLILGTIWELVLVILGTVAVFVVLRGLAKRYYARLGAATQDASAARTLGLWLASAAIDLMIVVAAWAAGYLLAILALGEFGQIGIRQTLYLNAFLIVEIVKVGVRMVLSPASGDLRFLPMADRTARGLTRWVNVIVSLVGYGQLLVVPIVNEQVAGVTGSAVSALIALVVLLMAVILVLRNRRRLADWMTGEEGIAGNRGSFGWLARHWHWPALAYLVAMFAVVLASPPALVFQTLMTSGQVILVVLAGIAVSTLLTRVMRSGVRVPPHVTEKLPLLEGRLNRFVPRGLFVLRTLIVVFVVLFALDAINLVSMREWLASQIGLRLTGMLFSVAAILVVAFGLWLALTSYVDYRLNPEHGQIATARERTLLTLGRNAATIALLVITLMFVLAEIGLNIGPLLASAGVLGLAIGFGAQKLVQDIITGVFIQFENAMNVGDIVTVGGTTGTVERLTIRSVSLRDLTGVYHIIPFSSVDMVSNYVRDFGYYVCDMGVAYREDVDEVKAAMLDAFEELRADPEMAPNILGDLEWFGVNELADSAVICRARIKCVPPAQWGTGRKYIEICKRIFDARGIEIPFPHQTIYLGEAKDGTTQTVRVARGEAHDPEPQRQVPAPEDDRAARPSEDHGIEAEGRG